MSNTIALDRRIAEIDMTDEDRARAIRAAHAGMALANVLNAIERVAVGIVRRWRGRSNARRSMIELQRLDDRLLADIGLSRTALEESLYRRHRDAGKSSVEVEISDMLPNRIAANQDHRDQRTAA